MATYMSSYCNKGHDTKDGKPIDHECVIIPPSALQAEREDRHADAVTIMSARHMPMHKGKLVCTS